jgi:hypothetical protein
MVSTPSITGSMSVDYGLWAAQGDKGSLPAPTALVIFGQPLDATCKLQPCSYILYRDRNKGPRIIS